MPDNIAMIATEPTDEALEDDDPKEVSQEDAEKLVDEPVSSEEEGA